MSTGYKKSVVCLELEIAPERVTICYIIESNAKVRSWRIGNIWACPQCPRLIVVVPSDFFRQLYISFLLNF